MKVKITKIFYILILLLTGGVVFAQGSTAETMQPFCAGGSVLTFPNTTGTGNANPGSAQSYGCLSTTPNAAWFYLQVGDSGTLSFLISQVDDNGTPRDVDFIAWGPFNSAPIYGPENLNPGTQVGCSYSTSATEAFSVSNAQSGQYYIILITNYSNRSGQISLHQTNAGQPGAGSTNCDIVCPLSLGPDSILCPGATTILTATIDGATSYVWSHNGSVIPSQSGRTLTVTQPGTYQVVVNKPGCTANATATVTISSPPPFPGNDPNDIITCSSAPYTFNLQDIESQMLGNLSPDDYIFSYHTSENGAITGYDDMIATPGAYTASDNQTIWVRLLNYNTNCTEIFSFNLVFTPGPSATPPTTLYECDADSDNHEIFDLTVQDGTVLGGQDPNEYQITYHLTQDAANDGTAPIAVPEAFYGTNQIIYVRISHVDNPNCFAITSFNLVVNPLPALTVPDSVAICDSYILPVLDVGNYYTGSNGSGDLLLEGSTLTSSQTIYIYAESGLAPNTCSNQVSFTVTIHETPVLTPVADISACESYTLPALTEGNYYTGPSGSGTPLSAGTEITSTTEIYIYSENPDFSDCHNEVSFTITISNLPVLGTPSAMELCDTDNDGSGTFDLTDAISQAINGQAGLTATVHTTLADAQSGDNPVSHIFTTPVASGQSQAYIRVIEADSTINCASVAVVELTAHPVPVLAPVADIFACESYTLPALTEGNYYTGPSGSGTALLSGTEITATAVIYIYAENPDFSDCHDEVSFTITISNPPVLGTPVAMETCDNNNDGSATFDLTTAISQAVNGQVGLTATVHTTLADAQSGDNPVSHIFTTPLASGQSQAYIRVIEADATINCASVATVQLTVHPRAVVPFNISPVHQCETPAHTEGVETFDLTVRAAAIIGTQDAVISYYTSQADAVAGTGAIAAPQSYTNTASPNQQTIWVRLDNEEGCYGTGSFTIVVDPLPAVIVPTPLTECNDAVGGTTAIFQLTEKNNEITQGAAYDIRYYNTLAQAQAGGNDNIGADYNGYDGEIIHVRADDPETGCVNFTTLTLSVIAGPVATIPAPLEVCDPNNDGVGSFNILPVVALIEQSLSDVSVTVHETYEDAEHLYNILSGLSNYLNPENVAQPKLYIRVQSALTDCYDIVVLDLIVHPTPVATVPSPYEMCESTPGSGTASFDFLTKEAEILGSLPAADYVITYHHSDTAAQNNSNRITNIRSFVNTGSPQTIHVRVTNRATGCYDVVEMELIVHPIPVINDPVPYTLCDVNNPGDQKENFDLTSKIEEIIGSQTGLTVTFHLSHADAVSGTGSLPEAATTAYENQSTVQTLFVRVESPYGCYSITLLDLRVEPLPVLTLPSQAALTLCDNDADGVSQFNLDELVADMINGGTLSVSFHETLINAEQNLHPISNTASYTNLYPFSQFLYIRAEDTETGCSNIFTIALKVTPSPIIPELDDLSLCDTDSDTQDFRTTFDLTVQDTVILAALPSTGNYAITYHVSQAAAEAGSPSIITPGSYAGNHGQEIWVRVTDTGSDCYNITSFELEVFRPLKLQIPAEYTLCTPLDGSTAIFDLTTRNNEILGPYGIGQGYIVTYYASQADVENNNPIANPEAYTLPSGVNPKTLSVVVTSPSPEHCQSYGYLTVRLLPVPNVLTENPEAIDACEDLSLGSGLAEFDLTEREQQLIGNNNSVVTLSYHTSQADADSGENPVANPEAHVSASGSIWIRVASNTTNANDPVCSRVIEMELIVNPAPAIAGNTPVSDYLYCEATAGGTHVFDLTEKTPEILGSQNPDDYRVRYYLTQTQAEAGGTDYLPFLYQNTSSPQLIWVRMENKDTGCYSTASFNLIVGAPAVANPVAEADRTVCDNQDDTNDGLAAFDLNQFTATILGSQPASAYNVAYYLTQADAQSGSNAIAASDLADFVTTTPDSQTLYVRVSHNISTCYDIMPLELIVIRKPEPAPFVEQPVCLDPDNPNAVVNPGVLNAGLVNPQNYTYTWYDPFGDEIPGENGPTLSVNTTGVYSVIASHYLISGCDSEVADVTMVSSSAPMGSVSISNSFADNQTITVNVTGQGDYVYRLDEGPWQQGNVFTNVSPGEHTVYVQDLNGCGPDAVYPVFMIDYPNFFTPNGDGYNDTWNIWSLSAQHNAKIYIFDRYGKLLKQIYPSGEGWDGTLNGQPVPSTDYWFSVMYTEVVNGVSVTKEFKAHFSLKR